MKTRISIVAASLLLPFLAASTVFAVESQDNPTTTQTQTTTEQTEKLSEQQKKQLTERVEKRKADAKLKLTIAQDKRLQSRCKNAQGLVKSVSGRSNGIETSRTEVHSNLVERLTKLQAKLDSKGVDTTALQAQIAELQIKIETFKTDFALYKQAVADVAAIEDCSADSAAFKASLDAARTALQKVRDDAIAIKAYVKDTIKPTLQTIRAQLEPKGSETSTEPTTETETN